MRRSKELKAEKELKRRYGQLAESMEPYYHQLDLRPFDDLDDYAFGCIAYLNQLPSLKFLHLKSTAVTISGLLQLTNLPELKELMFSADDVNLIGSAMQQLKALLPGCAFTVNSSPWVFDETVV